MGRFSAFSLPLYTRWERKQFRKSWDWTQVHLLHKRLQTPWLLEPENTVFMVTCPPMQSSFFNQARKKFFFLMKKRERMGLLGIRSNIDWRKERFSISHNLWMMILCIGSSWIGDSFSSPLSSFAFVFFHSPFSSSFLDIDFTCLLAHWVSFCSYCPTCVIFNVTKWSCLQFFF